MGDTTGVLPPDLRGSASPDHHSVLPEDSSPATATTDPHSQGNGAPHSNGVNGLRKGLPRVSSSSTPSPGSNLRLKASRSNFTVPQPFSLTTEKRASAGSKTGVNGVPSSTPAKTQKIGTSTKKVESPAAPTPKPSIPSPSAGMKTTPRGPKSEFIFRSDERAQKRMEFYANLTEKSKAREAEKHRIQASTQQQVAAEIKKLRKDQTFKATPMPKFYQEPAPARIDVKKTPPTRPKSPKLGRRASTAEGEPKIIARRSSDEYDMSKVPPPVPVPAPAPVTTDTKSTSEPANIPEEKAPQQHALQDGTEEVGSEHSSSRKSDSVVPKAALSEDEDHASTHAAAFDSVIPKAALSEDEDHVSTHGGVSSSMIPKAAPSEDEDRQAPVENSRWTAQPTISVAEEFDGMFQLPVSSSLLDDGDDELGDDYDLPASDGEEEFPSPSSDEQRGPKVRVYISEEFRQAAEAAPAEDDEDEGDGEEEVDEEDGEEHHETSQKLYVNNV